MGASNELPESEELDALYDRFLLRRAGMYLCALRTGGQLHRCAGAAELRILNSSSMLPAAMAIRNELPAPSALGTLVPEEKTTQ